MRTYLFLILFILLSFNVDAWNSHYHRSLAETVYYHLDVNVQRELNLTLIKEGATAPDLVFHDVVLHHYPPSYTKASQWLEKARLSYKDKDYNDASYSFGVASHYITDSFVAPHYTSKEPGSLHSEFENLKPYRFKSKCADAKINLNQSVFTGSLNKEDWGLWLLSKDKEIPQKEVEQALSTLYPVALETFNTKCNDFNTEIVKGKFNLLKLFKN